MKRFFRMMCLMAAVVMMAACGNGKHDGYVGKFTDEFGNKFELRSDYKGTLQLSGFDKAFDITWSDGDNHELPYAMISFNGNPAYYYLRDGVLYTSEEHMTKGHPAIQITWDED